MAAAVGNKYGIGNSNAGKPAKYTPEEFAVNVKHYFDTITIDAPAFDYVVIGKDDEDKDILDKVPRLNNAGEQVVNREYLQNPSILGLCLHIGISRETLCRYEDKEGYRDTVKEAKLKVEQYLADQLNRTTQVAGIIFNLKNNFGWKDVQTVENTGPNGGPLLIQAVSAYSDEDLRLMAEIMERAAIQGEIVDIEPKD